jgi:flagellar protein FlgJ
MEISNGINWNVPATGTNILDTVTGKAAQTKDSKDAAASKKVAKEFETLFVGMMLKSMRETVGKDKLTNGGHGEEVYRSMLDQEYAKSLTEHGGIGLTAMLERQLGKPNPERIGKQGITNHDTSITRNKTGDSNENR